MKYRSKPIEIEAYRYPGNLKEAPEWIKKAWDSEIIFLKEIYEDNYLCLKTPAGDMFIFEGDYITNDRGELDCYDEIIFNQLFEKVEVPGTEGVNNGQML